MSQERGTNAGGRLGVQQAVPRKVNDILDLLSFLGGYWPLFIFCIVLNICANLAYGPGVAYSLAVLTDSIIARDIALVWKAARLLVLMAVTMGSLAGLSHFLSSWTLEAVAVNIRRKVISRALRAPLSYWHTHKTGDTVSVLINDTEAAKQGLSMFHGLIGNIGLIVSCVVTLIAWGPATALALLAVAGINTYVGARFALPVRKASDEYQSETANTTSAAAELLTGMAVVKSLNAEGTALERVRRIICRLYDVGRRRGRLFGLQSGATGITSALSSSGVFLVAAFLTLRGRMTVGQAIGVMQLASLPISVFSSLGQSWAAIQQNLAASRRIMDAMNIPVELEAGHAVTEDERPPGDRDILLEFQSVAFGYEPEKPVLNGASFSVMEREKVALVGPSGCGKTSVLRLVQRFYEPWEGTIRFRGVDIFRMPLREIRARVGLLTQEPYIFPGTVRENIAMGNEEASLDQIIVAAKLANAHDFITALPEGYDTVLDERGGNLSGGQKQRICLARAFLKDADLLLLDEPTSAVDAESEALIRQSVDEYASRKGVLVVSHTEGVVAGAGTVLSLVDGKVVEKAPS